MSDENTYEVEFSNTGEKLEVSGRETILDACIDEGIAQEYSCRVGMCLACVAKIEEGDVKQPGARGLSEKEKEDYVLTCMARAESDLVLERGVYPPSIEGDSGQTAMGDGGKECCESSEE
ncbi:MAG: 2Fe-2S iron-sulfur cluster-binding protein [Halobacteria archaeon]|nr:2Fe-2S iron-sulfur cluster-binding protein [Halobacteria archaeon]